MPTRSSTPPRWLSSLTGLGFTVGSLEHAAQAVMAVSKGVPSWRHTQMTLVDAAIAAVAFKYPRFLVLCLFAFLTEQAVAHGSWAWNQWTTNRQIPWQLVLVDGLVLLAMLGAAFTARKDLRG